MKSPAPFLSLNTRGSFAKSLIALNRKDSNCVQMWHKPSGRPTYSQNLVRSKFFAGKTSWNSLTFLEKTFYNALATDRPYTGYNLYMSLFMQTNSTPDSKYGLAYYGLSLYGNLAGA